MESFKLALPKFESTFEAVRDAQANMERWFHTASIQGP